MPDQQDPFPASRLPNETAKAYRAFCAYRDIGTGRTLEKAAQECKKSVSLIRRWSSTYQWVGRVREWDDRQDEINRDLFEEERITMVRRHLESARLQITTGEALIIQAQKYLEDSKDTLTPLEIKGFLDVANRLITEGRKTERQCLGDPAPPYREEHPVFWRFVMEGEDGIEEEI